jgi:glycosyltransferase involved in cell wall biosynthesis
MKLPLVSVIIPCYNVSIYVDRAIRSILGQTYKNLEILIIDDASTDDTLSKIQSFNDNRIRVIVFKENTKKIGAVNEVLKKVNGDLICFQDADDWSDATRIEKQVNQFTKIKELGICFTAYKNIGDKKDIPSPISLSNEDLRDEFIDFGHKKNKHFNATCCPSMMISKAVLNDFCGYDTYFIGRVGEDIHWIYRILKKFQGVSINEPLYNYTLRIDSLTGNQFMGNNPKAAYAWKLLSVIIFKDIYEKFDLLDSENINALKEIELLACEAALLEQIKLNHKTTAAYEKSRSFKIGKIVLMPFKKLAELRKFFK